MRMFKSLKSENGFALIAVIFLMVAVGGMGVAVQKISSNQSEQAVSSAEVEDSYFTAQSGIELGIQLAYTGSMTDVTKLQALNGQSYTLPNGKSFTLAYHKTASGQYPADTLVAQAPVGSSEREVMFTNLSTKMVAMIPGGGGSLGSCTIPDSTAVSDPELTEATFPSDDHFAELTIKDSANITITGPKTIYIDGDFKLKDSASLTISGDVVFVVTGEVKFEDDSSITMSSGANLYVHAGDELKVKYNANVNSVGNASDVLLTSADKVKLEDSSTVSAGAYSANDFELKDSANFNGSLGSDANAKQKDSSTFSYDSTGGDGITGDSSFTVCQTLTNGLSDSISSGGEEDDD